MDNLQPVSDLDELPEGFSKNDPNASAGGPQQGGGGGGGQEEQKQAILEQALTPEALARLRRIKLVKEKKVLALENTIAAMAISGKLPGQINEGKLIEMLERGSAKAEAAEGNKGKISIQRKKYALDSDSDDDDEDLM